MATYVSLISWTDQGIKAFKDTLDRAEAGKELAAKFGGSLKEIYWTLGPYDIVTIIEAPDDEAVTAAMLKLGALGNVRTTTLRVGHMGITSSPMYVLPTLSALEMTLRDLGYRTEAGAGVAAAQALFAGPSA